MNKMDKEELIKTVIAFANKMSFPWELYSFTHLGELIVELAVYSRNCDPKVSDPIMFWQWYAKDWSECDGYF